MTNIANGQVSIMPSHARRYFRKKNTRVSPSAAYLITKYIQSISTKFDIENLNQTSL
jgi:hypothetical protein